MFDHVDYNGIGDTKGRELLHMVLATEMTW